MGRKVKDYTGMKFNKLTVLGLDKEKNKKEYEKYLNGEIKRHMPLYWICKCDCGNIISTQMQHLIHNDTKSCGCIMKSDLINKRFGRLTVIELDKERNLKEKERVKNGEIKIASVCWKCKCDCGNIVSVTASRLSSNKTISCGCHKKEVISKIKSKENEYEFLEDGIVKGWDTKHEHYFLIDKQDYEVVKQYCWVSKKGKVEGDFYWYAYVKGKGNKIGLHQLIMTFINDKYEPCKQYLLDHIDRNPSNNTRNNLRLVNQQENGKNKKTSYKNTSGKQGISWDKNSNSWHCYINYEKGKRINKRFKTLEEAMNQRLEWEKNLVILVNKKCKSL